MINVYFILTSITAYMVLSFILFLLFLRDTSSIQRMNLFEKFLFFVSQIPMIALLMVGSVIFAVVGLFGYVGQVIFLKKNCAEYNVIIYFKKLISLEPQTCTVNVDGEKV